MNSSHGIPDAAAMNTGDLVFAMVDAGFTTARIREILSTPRSSPDPALVPERPAVNVEDLLASGVGRGEIHDALNPEIQRFAGAPIAPTGASVQFPSSGTLSPNLIDLRPGAPMTEQKLEYLRRQMQRGFSP